MLMHHSAQFIVDSEYAAYDKTIQITHMVNHTLCLKYICSFRSSCLNCLSMQKTHLVKSMWATLAPFCWPSQHHQN